MKTENETLIAKVIAVSIMASELIISLDGDRSIFVVKAPEDQVMKIFEKRAEYVRLEATVTRDYMTNDIIRIEAKKAIPFKMVKDQEQTNG